MNRETPIVRKVVEQNLRQRTYGTTRSLIFGSAMIVSFIIVYSLLNNFVFRAFFERYFMSPLPQLIFGFGYLICFGLLILAFFFFMEYFLNPRNVADGLTSTQKFLLGIKDRLKGEDQSSKTSTSPSKPNGLPRPAWATPTKSTPGKGSHKLSPNGSTSNDTPSKRPRSVGSPPIPRPNSSPGRPTSPQTISPIHTISTSTPRNMSPWVNRSPTSIPRVSTSLIYPSTPTPSSPGVMSPSRTLGINSYGRYYSKSPYPAGSSAMLATEASPATSTVGGLASPIANFQTGSSLGEAPTPFNNQPTSYFNTNITSTPGYGLSPIPSSQNGGVAVPSTPSHYLMATTNASSPFSIDSDMFMRSPSSASRSSPSSFYSFSDESRLNEFITQQRRTEAAREAKTIANRNSDSTYSSLMNGPVSSIFPSSSVTSGAIKLPTYMSVTPSKSSDKPLNNQDGDYTVDEKKARALYQQLGIGYSLEQWRNNFRIWMSKHILRPLVAWMQEIETHLGKEALYQAQFSQVQTTVQNLQNQQAQLFSLKPIVSSTTSGDQQQRQLLQERMKLEKYFGDFGPAREYAVERIRQLAQGGVMPYYSWNSGGRWKDKDWTNELPTDAQIISHLFCCHLDQYISATDSAHMNDAFKSTYFTTSDDKTPRHLAIVQKSALPPHFNLMVNRKEWAIYPGRNNLFDTICVFVYVVDRDYKGMLNQRYLGLDLELLDIISD